MCSDWPLAVLCLENITCHLADRPRHFLSPSPWGPTPGTRAAEGAWGGAQQARVQVQPAICQPRGLFRPHFLIAIRPVNSLALVLHQNFLRLHVWFCAERPNEDTALLSRLWHRDIQHNMNRKIVAGLTGLQSRPGRPFWGGSLHQRVGRSGWTKAQGLM